MVDARSLNVTAVSLSPVSFTRSQVLELSGVRTCPRFRVSDRFWGGDGSGSGFEEGLEMRGMLGLEFGD